ncbi:sensor histidine kinase [Paenibacillus glycinis]|uniref:histidine kinase n=1 Tax=Paenibacillus glycinis TaxID=2697035 RepID=A0ABW9XIC2_9BACL|nr:HAMP domain-containing sensor histidine kinase [Paenibacillus glycinis]NBD22360.1 sensor histidine kinase [Paenibacillus glycinis]
MAKPKRVPKPKPPMWLQVVKVIAGILLMNVLTYTCFFISYTVIGFVKEKHGQAAITERLVQDGRLITDALGSKPAADWPVMLQAIAKERRYTVVLADAAGKLTYSTANGDGNRNNIEQEDVQQVIAGVEVKEIDRRYPFSEGTAVAGVPAVIDGQPTGLFLAQKAPSLYHDFWQQVLTVFFGFLLMFILMMLIGRPWREQGGVYVYISAIRRMSKGDFTVSIDKAEKMRGHFGELAASINDMAAELNQMEQMRQAFISNVSHEIQSPLTSIRGFARALQQDGLDEQQRQHYAGIIEAESIRMSRLSDNLMKLTTLEADEQQLHPKPFRLDQQLRAMILACEPIWTEKNILMDVNLDERVILTGDEELLSQVWMNVLTNSLKYTSEGGTVSVEVKRSAEGAVVVISDNGIGIDKEDLPHIFERFFKADKSRTRRHNGSGSGLGLSIVKVIVDMHGGQVKARSKPGVGTTITISLPNLPDKQA